MAFFKSLICCALIFGIASAQIRYRNIPIRFVRDAPPAGAAFNANPRDIQVTNYVNNIDPATGSFEYSYQQNDGATVSAKGFLNQNGKQVIEGSYAFVDAVGTPVQIQYTADENGYQAVGDAIPQPDPIIAKSVAYLRSLPPSAEDNKP